MVLSEYELKEEYSFAYSKYLANVAYNENRLYYTTEALDILNEEDNSDKKKNLIKDFITKISNKIIEVWHKFVRAVEHLFTSNNKYLERNKDIILNKTPKKATIKDYYRYQIKELQNTKIISIDDARIKDKTFKDQNEFIKNIGEFNKFMTDQNKSFVDNIKNHFRGGDSTTIESSALDMKKMYEYCHDYNSTTRKAIESNIDKLQEYNKKAFSIIDKMARGSKSTFNKKSSVTNTTDNDDKNNNNTSSNNASFMYNGLQYYFNEVEVEDKEDNSTSDNNSDNTNNDSSSTDNTQTNDSNNTNDNKVQEELIKMYFNTTADFLGAQMNIANEAYKTYFQIIKWHVKNYNKDDKPDEDNKNDNEKEETKEDKK